MHHLSTRGQQAISRRFRLGNIPESILEQICGDLALHKPPTLMEQDHLQGAF